MDSFDLSLVWILLVGIVFHVIALSRNLFGPLPEFLCWIQAFTRNSTGVAACLMFDILIIFRVSLLKIVNKQLIFKMFLNFLVLVYICHQQFYFGQGRFTLQIFQLGCILDCKYGWIVTYAISRKTRS